MSCSFCASSRAEMSVAPPGGNGTMNLTGFCGQAWAWTVPAMANAAAKTSSLRSMIATSS
jgi:hypothetical protein